MTIYEEVLSLSAENKVISRQITTKKEGLDLNKIIPETLKVIGVTIGGGLTLAGICKIVAKENVGDIVASTALKLVK